MGTGQGPLSAIESQQAATYELTEILGSENEQGVDNRIRSLDVDSRTDTVGTLVGRSVDTIGDAKGT